MFLAEIHCIKLLIDLYELIQTDDVFLQTMIVCRQSKLRWLNIQKAGMD